MHSKAKGCGLECQCKEVPNRIKIKNECTEMQNPHTNIALQITTFTIVRSTWHHLFTFQTFFIGP